MRNHKIKQAGWLWLCTVATCFVFLQHGATAQQQVKAPRYLLFWQNPEQASQLVTTIGVKGDGKTRLLGFGFPCATFVLEKQTPTLIHRAFAAARANNLAIMLHFDFHIEWSNRPDLWNWFDPTKPGYNPANKQNVEWFGWDGPVAKHRYLNWGEAQRMPPPVCFTSKSIRAEWSRLIHKVIAPALTQEIAALQREGKGVLFAGVLVGSEPAFDNYTHTDPEAAKLVKADGSPTGQLGYRSLLDSGYTKAKPPHDIHAALGKVIQNTVEFWCREFVAAGVSPDKLYPHIPAGADMQTTSAPIDSAFNPVSHPGWSTYAVGPLLETFDPLYTALKRRGNPAWGGVEANAGMPGSLVDWETYLGWHFNHGASLVAINCGATGTQLPARLERSAFSAPALMAYRKFLNGEALQEKRISQEAQSKELRRRVDVVQAEMKRWISEGRDPSEISRDLETRIPKLLNEGWIEEAEAVLDAALKRLKSGH